VFLKSLTLKGFKSFADSTTLDLEPGVTVVVGPNGSGKSNVVDAVAWVLGAQGPKTVRSAKMEDVIFAGTPKRAALGRAEVALTIDNSAGLLPIDFSEVTITRTLWRNGDSEYAINGVSCRLLDVQDLLSDTGVGRQQHVIISQGQLDAILNSRPEDRRAVIEEAAGILKHRRRKEKAERRLENTEASLLRVQDLLREVRRQLRPLERQAEAARRHGQVMAELTALKRHLSGRELAAIQARLASAAGTRSDLSRNEEEVRVALGRLDASVLAAEASLDGLRRRTEATDLAEAVSRAEGLRARASGIVALLGERRRSVERERNASIDQDVVSSLEAEAATLAGQLADTERDAEGLLPIEEELRAAEETLALEQAQFDETWGSGAESPSGAGAGAQTRRESAETSGGAAAEVRGELAALRRALERADGELRRFESRAEATTGRASRTRAEVERLRAVVAETERAEPDLRRNAQQASEVLSAADATLAGADEARRAADAERHRWSARAEALSQALDEARARAGAQRLAQVEGVVGALLELVEVDEGWETAFEAAAGEALAAVVVEGPDAARRSLAHLRELSAAGAVMALDALDQLNGGSIPKPALVAPVGTESLRAHVRSWLPGVAELLDRLVGRAVVVPGDWAEAVDVAAARPDLIVVTRSGDRCADGLWRTGASGAGATGAALEEARTALAAATEAAEHALSAQRDAKLAVERARAARSEATRAVDTNLSRRRASADALRRAEGELTDANAEAENLASQRAELVERRAREEARVGELEALLPELEAAAAEEAQRALAERAARSRLSERVAAVGALRRNLEVRAAGLEERRTLLTRRLAEVETRLARNLAEREEAAERRVRLDAILVATDRLSVVVTERLRLIEETLGTLREARRVEQDALRQRTDRLEQLRRQRATAERSLSEVRERLSRIDLEDAELAVRLETLTETVRRELDCEPDTLREAECPPLPPGTSAPNRARELERELRLMGPINPLALEEFAALQERNQFLEGQLEDVRSARKELTKVIKAVDAEIVTVFRAAFADVEEHFASLFSTLFPGGQGRIRLTDDQNLLETGIEIEARPSGKNVRRLSLLSGGERSLVAMAFLFAVFRSRPSPFYLMDEVEAALDDVNLQRFLDLVHEFRNEAQLLIVSHQKRTMEAADCLYGVTMPPGGSSRVVSEKVRTTA
jgi:chromosome segregation protein